MSRVRPPCSRPLAAAAWLLAVAWSVAAAAHPPAPSPASASAPASGTSPAAATACSLTLDLHVVDTVSHLPVIGALVALGDGAAAITAATNEDGRAALRGLCPGPLTLDVSLDGFLAARRTVTLPTTASVELELTPVAGEVVTIAGVAPVEIDMRSTTTLDGEALERTRGRSLADALAEVPGVSRLQSGSGAAKPIVRGQVGRRLVLMVDGLRHRAQDWGLDHAPEIDPFAADAIAVVRGAAGVRYGPDAIGGVIRVEPPPLPRAPGVGGELHLIGLSNGLGGVVAGRVQGASAALPGVAARLEGSARRQAAVVTPDYPLANTGAREWRLGGTLGYRLADTDLALSASRFAADRGVCACLRIESSDDFADSLDRGAPVGAETYDAALAIARPRQAVVHDVVQARGEQRIAGLGRLLARYGFQHDRRREFDVVRDATTGPQFDFRLRTHDAELVLEHRPLHVSDHLHVAGSVGLAAMAQDHAYGGLPLVPDHTAVAGGAYAVERLVGHAFELEAGVRVDRLARTASIARRDFLRMVRSDQLAATACGAGDDDDPVACRSTFDTVSASLGGLRQLTPAASIKLDLSTASRPPQPDEQYLNGTSPTAPVFGLGDPGLGPETTWSSSATASYAGERLTAEASAYANLIDDYVDSRPAIGADGEPIFDVLVRGAFPRFVTAARDVVFYGADGGAAFAVRPWLELGAQVALVRARDVDGGGALLFVPPDQARASVTFRRAGDGDLGESYLAIAGTVVAEQTRVDPRADLAPPPPAYALLGVEAGTAARVDGRVVKLAAQGSNLTNARYRDYTSLLRYFAEQPGWSVAVRMTVEFSE